MICFHFKLFLFHCRVGFSSVPISLIWHKTIKSFALPMSIYNDKRHNFHFCHYCFFHPICISCFPMPTIWCIHYNWTCCMFALYRGRPQHLQTEHFSQKLRIAVLMFGFSSFFNSSNTS